MFDMLVDAGTREGLLPAVSATWGTASTRSSRCHPPRIRWQWLTGGSENSTQPRDSPTGLDLCMRSSRAVWTSWSVKTSSANS